MASSDTRLVVVTYDTAFYNMVNIGLLRAGGVGAVSHENNISTVEHKFSKNKDNILVLDIDRGVINHVQIKQMLSKYRLLVIVTGKSNPMAAQFLKIGVSDFITKPFAATSTQSDIFIRALMSKIAQFLSASTSVSGMDVFKTVDTSQKIIAVAASTGGPEAFEKILKDLPQDIPPMLVVQHMPSGFTKLYADRLNSTYRMEVKEAANNDYLRKGVIYIAPADYHMALARSNNKLLLRCYVGAKMHGVMPAADVLFDSVAPIMKSNAVGVILTGMGADGAKGLKNMRLNGAHTIGQSKETCVVYGMPKVAYELGAVEEQLPLQNIASAIMKLCR